MDINTIINKLKLLSRFNLDHYREGNYGIDTERRYDQDNGDYIDSYEIDELIKQLEIDDVNFKLKEYYKMAQKYNLEDFIKIVNEVQK